MQSVDTSKVDGARDEIRLLGQYGAVGLFLSGELMLFTLFYKHSPWHAESLSFV